MSRTGKSAMMQKKKADVRPGKKRQRTEKCGNLGRTKCITSKSKPKIESKTSKTWHNTSFPVVTRNKLKEYESWKHTSGRSNGRRAQLMGDIQSPHLYYHLGDIPQDVSSRVTIRSYHAIDSPPEKMLLPGTTSTTTRKVDKRICLEKDDGPKTFDSEYYSMMTRSQNSQLKNKEILLPGADSTTERCLWKKDKRVVFERANGVDTSQSEYRPIMSRSLNLLLKEEVHSHPFHDAPSLGDMEGNSACASAAEEQTDGNCARDWKMHSRIEIGTALRGGASQQSHNVSSERQINVGIYKRDASVQTESVLSEKLNPTNREIDTIKTYDLDPNSYWITEREEVYPVFNHISSLAQSLFCSNIEQLPKYLKPEGFRFNNQDQIERGAKYHVQSQLHDRVLKRKKDGHRLSETDLVSSEKPSNTTNLEVDIDKTYDLDPNSYWITIHHEEVHPVFNQMSSWTQSLFCSNSEQLPINMKLASLSFSNQCEIEKEFKYFGTQMVNPVQCQLQDGMLEIKKDDHQSSKTDPVSSEKPQNTTNRGVNMGKTNDLDPNCNWNIQQEEVCPAFNQMSSWAQSLFRNNSEQFPINLKSADFEFKSHNQIERESKYHETEMVNPVQNQFHNGALEMKSDGRLSSEKTFPNDFGEQKSLSKDTLSKGFKDYSPKTSSERSYFNHESFHNNIGQISSLELSLIQQLGENSLPKAKKLKSLEIRRKDKQEKRFRRSFWSRRSLEPLQEIVEDTQQNGTQVSSSSNLKLFQSEHSKTAPSWDTLHRKEDTDILLRAKRPKSLTSDVIKYLQIPLEIRKMSRSKVETPLYQQIQTGICQKTASNQVPFQAYLEMRCGLSPKSSRTVNIRGKEDTDVLPRAKRPKSLTSDTVKYRQVPLKMRSRLRSKVETPSHQQIQTGICQKTVTNQVPFEACLEMRCGLSPKSSRTMSIRRKEDTDILPKTKKLKSLASDTVKYRQVPLEIRNKSRSKVETPSHQPIQAVICQKIATNHMPFEAFLEMRPGLSPKSSRTMSIRRKADTDILPKTKRPKSLASVTVKYRQVPLEIRNRSRSNVETSSHQQIQASIRQNAATNQMPFEACMEMKPGLSPKTSRIMSIRKIPSSSYASKPMRMATPIEEALVHFQCTQSNLPLAITQPANELLKKAVEFYQNYIPW